MKTTGAIATGTGAAAAITADNSLTASRVAIFHNTGDYDIAVYDSQQSGAKVMELEPGRSEPFHIHPAHVFKYGTNPIVHQPSKRLADFTANSPDGASELVVRYI